MSRALRGELLISIARLCESTGANGNRSIVRHERHRVRLTAAPDGGSFGSDKGPELLGPARAHHTQTCRDFAQARALHRSQLE